MGVRSPLDCERRHGRDESPRGRHDRGVPRDGDRVRGARTRQRDDRPKHEHPSDRRQRNRDPCGYADRQHDGERRWRHRDGAASPGCGGCQRDHRARANPERSGQADNSILRAGGKAAIRPEHQRGRRDGGRLLLGLRPQLQHIERGKRKHRRGERVKRRRRGFVSWGDGNYRLLPTSRLVDAGDPAAAQGVDLDGNPLVADGNGDGIARRDMGAFELQPDSPGSGPGGTGTADTLAPVVRGFSATRTAFSVARASTPVAARAPGGTRLRYTLSERARVTVAIQRTVKRGGHVRHRTVGSLTRDAAQGANTIRFSGRIGKRALRPGRYRAVIRATDTAGNRSQPRTVRLRVKRS